jgi:hypothetical protein
MFRFLKKNAYVSLQVLTQGFPPCKVFPGRLSYMEEAEVKKQIDVLVDLGKMKPDNFEYTCQ